MNVGDLLTPIRAAWATLIWLLPTVAEAGTVIVKFSYGGRLVSWYTGLKGPLYRIVPRISSALLQGADAHEERPIAMPTSVDPLREFWMIN